MKLHVVRRVCALMFEGERTDSGNSLSLNCWIFLAFFAIRSNFVVQHIKKK